MIKAIFYKEFIKTRFLMLLCLVLSIAMLTYLGLDVQREFRTSSGSSLCLTVLTKELIYYELYAYIPVLLGVIFALAQYLPEVYHKRLKLTFHLPISTNKIIATMLIYGLFMLLSIFGLSFLFAYYTVRMFFPIELSLRILYTMLPWFLAGVSAYGFASWIIVEASWRLRLINVLIAVSSLSLFYLNPFPEAYNCSLLLLLGLSIFSLFLIYLSADNFKSGL